MNSWRDFLFRFSRRQVYSVAALLLYSFLSVILTYPVIRDPWHAVPSDLGDPLMILWALGWNYHNGLRFAAHDFWQANIFYPAADVLTYSEHFFSSALLGLPVYGLSHSLILTYNFLFLTSFILSGWGMYLLVRDLTEQEAPALVCGAIFAFCPFRFGHLPHLQLLTCQWIPLVFLYLNRFLKRKTYRAVWLFTLFFLLQALACGYYAVFTSIFVALFIGYHFYTQRDLCRWDVCRKLLISGLVIFVSAGPFFYPYIRAKPTYGHSRSVGEAIEFSANPTSYLCAPPINHVWGRITQRFNKAEGQLHPGLVLIVLAGVGAAISFRSAVPAQRRMAGFALLTALSALVLSLGPRIQVLGLSLPGPYFLLYKLVPGFDGLRVPARFGLFFVFGAVLLAGYGIAAILQRTRTPKRVASVLGALVLVEYFSVPIPTAMVPGKGEPLPVYRWLGSQEGNLPVLELPTRGLNVEYNYFSVFHWKDLVNGYSGYFPPWYRPIHTLFDSFPSSDALDLLEELGVRLVIVHTDRLEEAAESIVSASSRFEDRLRKIQSFGSDEVYEVIRAQQITRETAASRMAGRIAQPGVDRGALKEFSHQLRSTAVSTTMRMHQTVRIPVWVKNTSRVAWPAYGVGEINPVHLAYHWLDQDGRVYQQNGERTGLPRVLGPEEEISVRMVVYTPAKPGRYTLRLTLVQENVAWFEDRGVQPLDIPVLVTTPETSR